MCCSNALVVPRVKGVEGDSYCKIYCQSIVFCICSIYTPAVIGMTMFEIVEFSVIFTTNNVQFVAIG